MICYCDVDLLMTLTYELDLDVLKTYVHTKHEVSIGWGFQKLEHKQYRHTDTQTDATEHITTAAFTGGKINAFGLYTLFSLGSTRPVRGRLSTILRYELSQRCV